MKRYLLVATAVVLVAPIMFGCKKQKKRTTITLIDELLRARVVCSNVNQVGERTFAIRGEKRRVLSMHPTSHVEYDMIIPQAARLTFGMGVAQFVWDKPGDGVLFKVEIDEGTGERETLFSRYINPKAVVPDRRWHDAEVDLSLYEGQKVTIILATEPGPENNGMYDNAGWSEPVLSGVFW